MGANGAFPDTLNTFKTSFALSRGIVHEKLLGATAAIATTLVGEVLQANRLAAGAV